MNLPFALLIYHSFVKASFVFDYNQYTLKVLSVQSIHLIGKKQIHVKVVQFGMECFTSKEQSINKLSGISWHTLHGFDSKTFSQEDLYWPYVSGLSGKTDDKTLI